MADAANLRLLRCPKCDNLLQELPDFSLYSCGGCGAVFEAKQKGVLENGSVKGRENSEGEGVVDAPMSRVEITESQSKGKQRIQKLESSNSDYPQGPARNRNQPYSLNVEGPEHVDFHRHPPMDQWVRKTNGPGGPAQTRFPDFKYYEEGQSSYERNTYYDPNELIMRLGELRDQISRSCDISDKSKERMFGSDPYCRPQAANYFPDDVSSPYFNAPYRDRYNPHMPDPRRKQHYSYRHEIPGRSLQPQYTQHHIYQEHFPGHYGPVLGPGINRHDHFMSRRHENFFPNEPSISPFGRHKFATADKNAQLILPIAGGAPFIVCTSCFETLKLPKKRILSGENRGKVKCGACSSIVMFKLWNTGITALSSGHVDQVPTEVDQGSSGTLGENVKYWNDGSNNAFSNDYKKSNSELLSPTSGRSEDEQIPVLTRVNSLPDESSLDSNNDITVDRFDKGKESRRKFVKDASVATEIDVTNEFTCESQDTIEASREGDLIKRNIKDSKKSDQSGEVCGSEVFVNEHFVPEVLVNGHFIPDRIVKKAEKLAGPIQPGEYWYDKRAGFWGVMGHPCLGIIMPNIEEFSYPMPQKCAAGNTEVFINGRELHHKDLDLLCRRGLPIARQRSYLVEITGKVIDEETGEELDGLGKLAPTVERSKCGFGMRIPRFIAQIQS